MNITSVENKKILIINCGSSSLKYEVYEMPSEKSLGKGTVERIGDKAAFIEQSSSKSKYKENHIIPDHKTAMELVLKLLVCPENGFLTNIDEISAIGHRVVHGGERYASSVLITDDVIKAIDENIELAPLHNPPNLTGIKETINLLPHLKQVAVFDTAFHQTLPPSAYLYGLPRSLYEKHKIRRYGFHGTSHRYVSSRAMQIIKRYPENTNIISCHLGNGASITAISQGKSIDTSMGFTPLEGLIMGTRSGDIDPSIIFFLMERGYSVQDLNKMLNKESGLLGLSEISNDLRDLEQAAENGNTNAQEALDVYAYRIRKYIGGYAANLVKVDVLIFTGGIGQHGVKMRERICHNLENLGIFMNYEQNNSLGSKEGIVSHNYSPTTIAVIPTNEELQIALDTYDIVFNGEKLDTNQDINVHI